MGEIENVVQVVANDVSVNKVDDVRFDYTFPEGTLVFDKIRGKAYYMPGGVESLDEAIATGVAIVDNTFSKAPPKGRVASGLNWRPVMIAANVVVVVILAVMWLYSIATKRAKGHT